MYSIKATDSNIKQLVNDGIRKYGYNANLNYIDTSSVTNINSLFEYSKFNGDISGWDTHNVKDMSYMFSNNKYFNGDLSGWDTHNVKDMSLMFYRSVFNGDISGWDTHNVKIMASMFSHSQFNGDLSLWDISNVENTYHMLDNDVYDKEILWDIDIEKLFGDSYNDYLERRKLKIIKSLCI